ncbi:MAG: hypothetical protein HOP33_17060 [Verrucomicrobia bacterium]|nr:hypothetical protein [Verrucomicrobiota bacterium]
MKALFKKFKASTGFDRGFKPRKDCEEDDMQRFEKSLLEMDRELRASRSNTLLPTNLHSSIMTAVRASDRQDEVVAPGFFWRQFAGVSLAFVAIIGLFFWLTDQSSLKDKATQFPPVITASITSGLNEGHELAEVAPKAALEPLSSEMELLGRDFRNAVTFLVASMP